MIMPPSVTSSCARLAFQFLARLNCSTLFFFFSFRSGRYHCMHAARSEKREMSGYFEASEFYESSLHATSPLWKCILLQERPLRQRFTVLE